MNRLSMRLMKQASLLGIFLLVFSLLGAGAPFRAEAFQNSGCGQDCASCHTLTKEEASKLIKADLFKAKVTSVQLSPVKGLWQIEGTREGQRFMVNLDFGKKYLVEARMTPLEDLGADPAQQKIDPSKVPLTGTILLGDPNAKIKVIVFDDPDCPYCRKLHETIKEILQKRKDIAFYIKLYPLDIHPQSYEKSKAILCQKSVSMLNDAFAGKELSKANCNSPEVDENIRLAKSLGINGTPFLILADGRVIPGYVDTQTLLNMIDNKSASAR